MQIEKPQLAGLVRDDPKTPEGKYLVKRRDGSVPEWPHFVKYLVKRRDGSVPEWPHFVLGGRDPHAPAAIRAYADSIEKDPDCHPDFPPRLRQMADEFDAYRQSHGAGDPTRGLHRRDDPTTVAEMKKSQSA